MKQAVIPAFKSGKAHHVLLAKPIKQIKRHPCIENPHIGKIFLQADIIAVLSVQSRALLGAQQTHEIVHQSVIQDHISLEP